MTILDNYLDKIKNEIEMVDDFISECPKCGNKKMQQVRMSARGQKNVHKTGLLCQKCKLMYLIK